MMSPRLSTPCVAMMLVLAFLFSMMTLPSTAYGQDHLLILNKSGDTAWYLNADNGDKIAEFETGEAPHEVAVSPDRNWAVITNYGNEKPGNTLTVIDLNRKKVAKTVDLRSYQRPHGIEWFSDSRRVIVTAEAQQAVITVDIPQGKVLSAIKTGARVTHMVSLSGDEMRAYVTNIGSGSLTVVDLQKQAIEKHISTGEGAEGMALFNDNNELWITNRADDNISVVNADTYEITHTLQSPSFPIRAQSSPDGRLVAVSNARSGTVSIFDADTKKKLKEIPTMPEHTGQNGVPIGLTFSNDGDRLFVANSEADHIAVFATRDWRLIHSWETGDTPDGIAFIPGG